MVWLTLLLVWAAASILVAVVWGKVVRWGQDGADEHPDAAPASGLDASAEAPSPDSPPRSHR
jgi:hypothetical protein